MLALNYVFNVPYTVLVPTSETNEQSEKEQFVDG
jgi:hypothetical protein